MPVYVGFYDESAKIVQEALSFSERTIKRYQSVQKTIVDSAHYDLIDKEVAKVLSDLEQAKIYTSKSFISLGAEDHNYLMDIIRSALEIYLKDTLDAKTKLGLTAFDARIQDIRRIINLESLKDRKTDVLGKFYKPPIKRSEGGRIEVFVSYSHDDRVLAGKIANLLKEKGVDVFLAHEDMEVSEEWREQIFAHLESSNILLALLTPNFEQSVWANQEAGFMNGKGGKIIPLIVEGTDIKKFWLYGSITRDFHYRRKNPILY